MKAGIICNLFVMYFTICNAQLPKTDIYLFDYNFDDKLVLSYPKLLTFDHDSYSNQPHFIHDDLYITQSHINNDTIQTDIVALNSKKRTKRQITQTKTSEYSPTLCPDGEHFSAIRVNEYNQQQLWIYPLDHSNNGRAILDSITNVGYHTWLNNNEVFLFLVDEDKGHQLVLANINTGEIQHISYKIGRCFKMTSQGQLVYIHKITEDNWNLMAYNPISQTKEVIGYPLSNQEDFGILNNDKIIIAYQGSFFALQAFEETSWTSIGQYSQFIDDKKISRIAMNNTQIALVTTEE